MHSRLRYPAFLILMFIRLSLPSVGQVNALRGLVTDREGNGLANASVQLLRHDSGRQGQVLGQAISGPDGQFEIRAASGGRLDIRVEAEGFREVTESID